MALVESSISISAARWLVGVISGVVLAFLLETAVTQHVESAIGSRTRDIVTNLMPSVQLLTLALSALDRLDDHLDQYAALPPDRRPGFREQISSDRNEIARALAAYVELPRYAGEGPLHAAVDANRKDLDALLDAALANGDTVLFPSVHRKLDAVQQSIQRTVEFDATQGERLGREIEGIRNASWFLVLWLDGLSVVLALSAVVLALRQLRRFKRVLEFARIASEQREAQLTSHAEALGHFAGQVAHDILSPLSTAMLSIQHLRHSCETDASACRAADRGVAAVRRVHNLVADLLAFSRAGGRPEPGSSTEIAPVVADVIDELGPQAKQRRITLDVDAIPEVAVACSAGVLTSLVSNLVRNAIRYMGDATERRIELRVLDLGERLRIAVEDTGPGIPIEQQKRVFEPYVQLGRGGTGSGIGLGLATVERLAHAHGGAVGLTSAPGHGSMFWFELPALLAAPNVAREHVPLHQT